MIAIEKPNSSGQGYCPKHLAHPLHKAVIEAGYTYSHSTNVGTLMGDEKIGWHTYKKGEHNVGLREPLSRHSLIWDTSTSCGSGRKWSGLGEPELRAHLKSKNRRYSM